MSDNILTPTFRAAFISIFKATKAKDAGDDAKAKFSIRAVFPPDTDISELKRQAQIAAEEKWGAGKVPKTVRSPFRTNEELENPIPGVADDAVVMTFSSTEDRKPGIVDANLNDIIDSSEVYSGAWFRAQVRAYGYDNKGNKGVSFGLQNVQKIKDDEPLGRGAMPASKAFSAVGGGSGKTATSVFD